MRGGDVGNLVDALTQGGYGGAEPPRPRRYRRAFVVANGHAIGDVAAGARPRRIEALYASEPAVEVPEGQALPALTAWAADKIAAASRYDRNRARQAPPRV